MPVINRDTTQGKEDWFKARLGKPTASNFSKLITSTGAASKSIGGYANLLAAELYAEKPLNDFGGNQWTDRGQELEEDARAKYELIKDADVEQVGFITNDGNTVLVSPDGLIGDDGLIEIKCLKAENHIEVILYYKKHKKCPPKYIQQTQGAIYISRREFCDLVFYYPGLPLLVIRQYPDSTIINGLTSQIHKVIELRDSVLKILQEM